MKHTVDERWMARCIALAEQGRGMVSPNPLVGALIVRKGKLVGKGFHERFGGPHAEVNAIQDAHRRRAPLRGATMYVNLEPCSHFGKTPPCVDAIAAAGIAKVVCAMKDPNPLVAGQGFRTLRSRGIAVVSGVLSAEAAKLNEKFTKFITTGLPFVAIKVAQTSDGFVARHDGTSRWITNKRSRTFAHELRAEYDAVLVGAGTILADNPRLTVRHIRGRSPRRIVLDGKFRSQASARLFNDRNRIETILFCGRGHPMKVRELQKKGVEVAVMKDRKGRISIRTVLAELGRRGIASVLVEGGPATYRSFLQEGVVDKAYIFSAPKSFGGGLAAFDLHARRFSLRQKSEVMIGNDVLVEGRVVFRTGR